MTDAHKQVTQHPRQRCYFCGSEGPIETHHIVPRRHSGENSDENLVDLCPTCHERLERLYDKRFFESLGCVDVASDNETSREQRDRIKKVKNIVANIEENHREGAPVDLVMGKINEVFDNVEKPKEEIHSLRVQGAVYEPKKGYLRTT